MRITRLVAMIAAAALVPAAIAGAAISPSGVYKGKVHFVDSAHHRISFAWQATFSTGKLTRLYGIGGGLPYDPKKSTSFTCGTANLYDSADKADHGKFAAKITGSLAKNGSFTFKVKGKFHDVITLSGKFVSARKAKATIHLYQSHLPSKTGSNGVCDSGKLPLTLKK